MATPTMDVGILKYFLPIITFLFVFTFAYAILEKTKILGSEQKGLSAVIAFVLAIIFVLTPGAMRIINFMIPWLLVLFFFVIFIVVIFMFLGVSTEDISRVMGSSAVVSTIITIAVILFLIAFANVYGEAIKEVKGGKTTNGNVTTIDGEEISASGEIGVSVLDIIFNPKVLAAALILLIASQAMRLLSISPKK